MRFLTSCCWYLAMQVALVLRYWSLSCLPPPQYSWGEGILACGAHSNEKWHFLLVYQYCNSGQSTCWCGQFVSDPLHAKKHPPLELMVYSVAYQGQWQWKNVLFYFKRCVQYEHESFMLIFPKAFEIGGTDPNCHSIIIKIYYINSVESG